MTIRILVVALLSVSSAEAQTSIDGSSLAFHSTGASCPDKAWCLNENGFVGTYIRLAAAGQVSCTIRVSKGDSETKSPLLRLRVADFTSSYPVTAVCPNYDTHTQIWELPAGTYCVRIESADRKASGRPWAIHVRDLYVTGATVVNRASDANALAAADTYIEHFRKGPATLTLTADTRLAPHARVRIRLKSHAFTFGTALSSSRIGLQRTPWLTSSDTSAVNYRNFILRNFNAVVPENAGKWDSNEPERDKLTLRHLDSFIDFAASNGKRVRMHGVLWDVSEPAWVRALKDTALNGSSQAQRDAAKADLRARISRRIQYFVRDRAHRYAELDVLNEAVHRPKYSRIFGVAGVAGIYNEVKAAVQAAGASTRIVPNEYDVLQSLGRIGDPYANWYRNHVESLRDAGAAVDGIGIQYYAVDDELARVRNPHSPSRIAQVLHNLATTDLPLTLSEFGVQKSGDPPPQRAAEILAEALRLSFGHEKMTTFIAWGFWRPRMWSVAPLGAFVDAEWNLTPAGKVWQQLTGVQDWKLANVPTWTTDVSLAADAMGRVDFTGFYGDYEVVAGQRRGEFTLSKGKSEYAVALSGTSNTADDTLEADLPMNKRATN